MHTRSDDFEWDPEKAEANWQKHSVSFIDAQEAFFDERAVSMEDTFPFEQRLSLIGTDTRGRLLVVVYAWRGDKIRIISARKVTSSEKRQYEGE